LRSAEMKQKRSDAEERERERGKPQGTFSESRDGLDFRRFSRS
jgi:hypothetical protein